MGSAQNADVDTLAFAPVTVSGDTLPVGTAVLLFVYTRGAQATAAAYPDVTPIGRNDVTGVTDSQGNTWVKVPDLSCVATPDTETTTDGILGECWSSVLTTTLGYSDVVTVSFTGHGLLLYAQVLQLDGIDLGTPGPHAAWSWRDDATDPTDPTTSPIYMDYVCKYSAAHGGSYLNYVAPGTAHKAAAIGHFVSTGSGGGPSQSYDAAGFNLPSKQQITGATFGGDSSDPTARYWAAVGWALLEGGGKVTHIDPAGELFLKQGTYKAAAFASWESDVPTTVVEDVLGADDTASGGVPGGGAGAPPQWSAHVAVRA
jgi:hypothetical protein